MKIHDMCPSRKIFSLKEIPMGLLNEEWAQKNHDQSLSRLNERGGLSLDEILAIVQRRAWHKMDDDKSVIIIQHMLTGYNAAQKIEQPSPVSLDTHTAEEILETVWRRETNKWYINSCANKYKKVFTIAMTEYASQESLKARQEAIEECKQWYIKNSPAPNPQRIAELEKLKSDSTKPPYEK